MPVVQVKDVRLPFVLLKHFEDHAAERLVARKVVHLAVDIHAVKRLGIAHEVDGDVADPVHRRDLNLPGLAREGDQERPACAGGLECAPGAGMTGRHDLDVVANFAEPLRQGGRNVREAPNFRKRGDFGGGEEDFHGELANSSRSSWARVSFAAARRQHASCLMRALPLPSWIALEANRMTSLRRRKPR